MNNTEYNNEYINYFIYSSLIKKKRLFILLSFAHNQY